jgi:isopenicillin N synthase-like dioxygenase
MKPIPVPLISNSTCSTFQNFGAELISNFTKFGYAYVSVSKNEKFNTNLNQVRAAGKKIIKDHFVLNNNSSSPSIDALRGFYRFQAASGRADDIRCFSVGNIENSIGQLRGEEYCKLSLDSNLSSTDTVDVFNKRNLWPESVDPSTKHILEEYYRLCSDISTRIATSIELALCFDKISEKEEEFPVLNWTNWMSKQDNHLECKLYAGVDEEYRIVDKNNNKLEQPPAAEPKSKSKILRRTKSTNNDIVAAGGGETKSSTIEQEQKLQQKLFDMRMNSHSDLSVVTLLLQDNLGGLEVFDNVAKEFVRVNLVPSTTTTATKENDDDDGVILVHAGMFLEKWSCGEIVATPHRIRTVKGAPERCSVVFFAFPNFDATIEQIDGRGSFVAGDEHPKL